MNQPDAIDSVLQRGPFKTGQRRLYLLDLLIGYGLRSEMTRGWWCQRALRIYGPYKNWCHWEQVTPQGHGDIVQLRAKNGYMSWPATQRWRSAYGARYVRVIQLHERVTDEPWRDYSGWKSERRAKARRVAIRLAWPLIRPRLWEETGYETIHTAEEGADAIKVYADRPKSIGYRALMTLADNPLVWSRVEGRAA